jgi:hypothetical protein
MIAPRTDHFFIYLIRPKRNELLRSKCDKMFLDISIFFLRCDVDSWIFYSTLFEMKVEHMYVLLFFSFSNIEFVFIQHAFRLKFNKNKRTYSLFSLGVLYIPSELFIPMRVISLNSSSSKVSPPFLLNWLLAVCWA